MLRRGFVRLPCMAERLNRRGRRPAGDDLADDVDRLRTGLSMGFGSEMDPRSREPETHCSAEWVCKHFVLNVVAVVFTLVIFLFTAMMFPPCVAACALCFAPVSSELRGDVSPHCDG